MLTTIKTYLNAILVVALLAGLGWSHWKAYDAGKGVIQAKFNLYKGEINDQMEKANAAAEKTRMVQDAKYILEQAGHAADVVLLDARLERLRKSKAVPGGQSVPVAGCGGSPVPTEATNTARVVETAAFGAGTFGSAEEFYDAAMKDVLQCRDLINFVK